MMDSLLRNPDLHTFEGNDRMMNCKNCETRIGDDAHYCHSCGAEVVTGRLTGKKIWHSLTNQFFGWDNKYLRTVKALLLRPETVLMPYFDGTRKRFVAPFAFLAIGTAISMLIFNQFSDEYMKMVEVINDTEYDFLQSQYDTPEQLQALEEQRLSQLQLNKDIQSSVLKYFNILTFLLVPVYAWMSKLVFGKPFNYGEHLVVTAYFQGFLFTISILLFLGSVFIHPSLFSFSMILGVVYYLYAYRRLYNLSFGKVVLAFLKFVGLMIAFTLAMGLIGIAFVLVQKSLG